MPITRAYGQASQLGNTPAASNPVLNSAMQVWQRGTSFSIGSNGAGQYTADRWYSRNTGAAVTISRQVTGDTTNLPNIQYCLRWQRDSGGTSTAPNYLNQSFETVNSIPFAGKTVTFSFYARKGANLSGTVAAQLYYGTGTDQNIMATYTGIVLVAQNSLSTLTTTWQRFTATGSVPATATELAINFDHAASGTAGAADYLEITGLQIDIGSVALPFRTNSATLAGELAACQRYYWRQVSGTTYGVVCTSGIMESTTGGSFVIQLPVPMRVAPTSIDTSNLRITDLHTTNSPASSFTLSDRNELFVLVRANASGLTANRPAWLTAYNSGASYLGLSAEL